MLLFPIGKWITVAFVSILSHAYIYIYVCVCVCVCIMYISIYICTHTHMFLFCLFISMSHDILFDKYNIPCHYNYCCSL